MKKIGGLRGRWLKNAVSVMISLGMACVLAVTACFAAYYYSDLESCMRGRAQNTMELFLQRQDMDYMSFYESCLQFAADFYDKDVVELQFVDENGVIVSSSVREWQGKTLQSNEANEAWNTRGISFFVGHDEVAGERVLSVSFPVIYGNGEVVGVLRYVTPTKLADIQIIVVAAVSLCVLLVLLAIVLLSSKYYIRTIMGPVAEINEKAKRIANGSYGIQIQHHYDDEIGELAETINEMSAKISQNEKMQAEFISQLSHELRTPLTVITGWSETLLMDEKMEGQTRQGMKIISQEAKRLTEMVVELLDFTRMQDGRMTLNVEPTDVRSVFEDTVFMYGSRLTQEGIALHYDESDEDIPEIPCDPKRLRQVYLNVLDNAAKHGGDGKRIDASMHLEDNQVVVRIRDYGPGIPEDEIPLVKKKFYKGSSKARGTGIGLAVCDEIMEMHGGSLTLENASGGGTLVTIALPAVL